MNPILLPPAAKIQSKRASGSTDLAALQSQSSRIEFVLASLRCTSLRVKLIEQEITTIGTALKNGFVSADAALEWAEQVAPGCIGFIPNTAYGTWGEV